MAMPFFPVLTTNAVPGGTPAESAIPSGTGIDSEGFTTGAFSAEVLSPGAYSGGVFLFQGQTGRALPVWMKRCG